MEPPPLSKTFLEQSLKYHNLKTPAMILSEKHNYNEMGYSFRKGQNRRMFKDTHRDLVNCFHTVFLLAEKWSILIKFHRLNYAFMYNIHLLETLRLLFRKCYLIMMPNEKLLPISKN